MPKKASAPSPLALRETRPPFTVALELALRTAQIAGKDLAQKKSELSFLVLESAKTFGFKTRESLDSALDITLGLLSFALVHTTQGEVLVDPWAKTLATKSWKEVAKQTVQIIRENKTAFEEHAFLLPPEDHFAKIPLRDELLNLVTLRTDDVWSGYRSYLALAQRRELAKNLDRLTRWLSRHFRVSLKEKTGGSADQYNLADFMSHEEAINTLLFRHCTGLGFGPQFILGSADFARVARDYRQAPAAWVKQARHRFLVLLGAVPKEHLATLGQDWFKRHLADGPPKTGAKKKSKTPDALEGITGIYHYDADEFDPLEEEEVVPVVKKTPVKKAKKKG